MNWDLTEEHSLVYEKDVCKKINFLTDTFDIIFEYIMDGMYPMMMCADVFLCEADVAVEIPRYIRMYSEVEGPSNYKMGQNNNYEYRLSLEKLEADSFLEILKQAINLDWVSKKWEGMSDTHFRNIEKAVELLETQMDVSDAVGYELNKESLKFLENTYIGMLLSGTVIKCDGYVILILYGTNE